MTLQELINDLKQLWNNFKCNFTVRVIDNEGRHHRLNFVSVKNPFIVLFLEPVDVANCKSCGEPEDYCDCDK